MKASSASGRPVRPGRSVAAVRKLVVALVVVLPYLLLLRIYLYTESSAENIAGELSKVRQLISSELADDTQPKMRSFQDYLNNSTSGKKVHNYGFMYAPYFDPIRDHEVAFLEIGLREGDSIDLWLSFFSNATVYGIDKGKSKFQGFRKRKDKRVNIFVGDQADVAFLKEVGKAVKSQVGQLDFVIDDGGHTMTQQITSFTHLMPLVKPGGMYFIEDLETSYYGKPCNYGCYGECCGGGKPGKSGTTIALIKSLIDVLNEDFIEGPNKKGLWNIGHYKVNPSDHLVGSIHCWRNMCALQKKQAESYF